MIGIGPSMGGASTPYLYMRPVGRVRPDIQGMPPVTPVPPADPVRPGRTERLFPSPKLPEIREGADPVEMAVRGRIRYLEQEEETAQAGEKTKSAQEVMQEGECQTCKERKYQDGSDDPGVSFKTATNVAPEQAASAVRGHEQEHVVREQAKAAREDRSVVSQSVTIHTAICPECGKAYVSGGTTRTTTRANTKPEVDQRSQAGQKPGFDAVA